MEEEELTKEEKEDKEFLEGNRKKILTPEVIEKLENCFQENLFGDSIDKKLFFCLKQKEMMSEIEDILGIECYE